MTNRRLWNCLIENFMNLHLLEMILGLDTMKQQRLIFKIKGTLNIFIKDV